MHALLLGHSLLIVHSGLQLGGDPINSFWQVHTACEFTSRHRLFGPQGDGVHGASFSTSENSKFSLV